VIHSTCIISESAKKWPDLPAIIDSDYCVSYQQLSDIIDHACLSLCQTSPDSKENLAFLTTGQTSDVIRILAAQRSQRCILPINPKLPGALLNRIFEDINYVYWNSGLDLSPKPKSNGLANDPDNKTDFPANWLLTSGSTSLPKIAVISYRNHIQSALGSLAINNSEPGDRYLQSLPLFHISGLATLYRCFLSGATLVMDRSKAQAQWLIDNRITHMSLVPTQLERMLTQKPVGHFAFKQILLGGGPIPESMNARKLSLPVMQTYGLTEMSSQVITRNVDGKDALLPNRELTIAADGEILVKGPTLFSGYLTKKGIELPLDEQGWFHTRDIGQWQNNNFCILGRKDNQFISGGENIQPETIEAILQQHPAIARAIVIPVSDKIYGCRPFAFIEYRAHFEFTEHNIDILSNEILESWLDSELPPYMRPIAFHTLPQQDGMKVNRPYLIQLAEQILDDSMA